MSRARKLVAGGLVASLAGIGLTLSYLLAGPRPACIPGRESEMIDACESAAIEAVVRHAVSAYLLPAAIVASALFGGLWWRWGRRE